MKTRLILVILLVTFIDFIKSVEQPNIIIILADDLGFNDVGYHNPDMMTPNIDQLAKTGIILEQSYVQPICTPSRSSLLTGMYPYLIGRQGYPISHKQPTGLTLDRKLISNYLGEKGYATHIVGKWHLGFCKEEFLPTSRGFDSHYGFWGGSQDYYTKSFRHGYDFRDDLDLDLSANNTYSEDLYEERVSILLREHAASNPGQPFFLYMSHHAPHSPVEPPQFYEDLYANITDDGRRKFSGTVTAMDDKVGALVQALKDSGMYENTVILFLGDNGGNPLLGAGGNNWPLRGFKGVVYEGGVRTPAFVHSPILKSTGLSIDHLFHVSDWLPTFYHLAGASDQEIKDQNFSGINQWPVLENPLGEGLREEIVVNLDDDKGTTFGALRQGRYKYIKNPGMWVGWVKPPTRGANGNAGQHLGDLGDVDNDELVDTLAEQSVDVLHQQSVDVLHLFDLEVDPEERFDLKHELPHIVQEMNERMEQLKEDMVYPDNIEEVEGGLVDGIWTSNWCE